MMVNNGCDFNTNSCVWSGQLRGVSSHHCAFNFHACTQQCLPEPSVNFVYPRIALICAGTYTGDGFTGVSLCTNVSRGEGSVQACYRTSILGAVELNRLSDNLFHFWVASLNMACALVTGSLYIPGLILEPYKRWPITVVLFNALMRFLL